MVGLGLEMLPAALLLSARAEWKYLQDECTFQGQRLRDINIDIAFDPHLDTNTLAYARFARVYKNGVWYPSALTTYTPAVDVEIGVNPAIHWDYGCDNDGWALSSVLLHELLHAGGISSTATPEGVGYAGTCVHTLLDAHMTLADGTPAVHECTLRSDTVYVGGVRLHGTPFRQGVSYAHHVDQGIMSATPPYECARLGLSEVKILSALGYECRGDYQLKEDAGLGRGQSRTAAYGRWALLAFALSLLVCLW